MCASAASNPARLPKAGIFGPANIAGRGAPGEGPPPREPGGKGLRRGWGLPPQAAGDLEGGHLVEDVLEDGEGAEGRPLLDAARPAALAHRDPPVDGGRGPDPLAPAAHADGRGGELGAEIAPRARPGVFVEAAHRVAFSGADGAPSAGDLDVRARRHNMRPPKKSSRENYGRRVYRRTTSRTPG